MLNLTIFPKKPGPEPVLYNSFAMAVVGKLGVYIAVSLHHVAKFTLLFNIAIAPIVSLCCCLTLPTLV